MPCKILTPLNLIASALAVLLSVTATLLTIPDARSSDPVRLLAIGDSLTAGYGLLSAESFPAQLQDALQSRGFQVEVINGGVSGDTTSGGLARLDWVLGDRPDAVILELGANDGLRAIDPDLTRDNLDKILTRLRDAKLPVLFAGMLAPPNLGAEFEREFNRIFPELSQQHEVLYYPFFLDGVATVKALNQADGIHPTAEGIAVIVERILPLVTQLLEQVPS